MNWNSWIRQTHRWLSLTFTVCVAANFVLLGQKESALRVGLFTLLPLALLLLTGLYPVRAAVRHQVARQKGDALASQQIGE